MALRGRFSSFDFWDGAAFGAAAAMLAIFLIGSLFQIVGFNPDRYVELALPVLAALLGIIGLSWVTRHQMNRQRAQDLASARAVLPLTLSRICHASQRGIEFFASPFIGDYQSWNKIISQLEIQPEDVSVLRDAVRSANPAASEWIVVLITNYQVALSQSRQFIEEAAPKDESARYASHLLQSNGDLPFHWSKVFAISEHLFDYARGGSDIVPENIDVSRLGHAIKWRDHDLKIKEFDSRLSRFTRRYGNGHISKFKVSAWWAD
jgi:hypothetical protein